MKLPFHFKNRFRTLGRERFGRTSWISSWTILGVEKVSISKACVRYPEDNAEGCHGHVNEWISDSAAVMLRVWAWVWAHLFSGLRTMESIRSAWNDLRGMKVRHQLLQGVSLGEPTITSLKAHVMVWGVQFPMHRVTWWAAYDKHFMTYWRSNDRGCFQGPSYKRIHLCTLWIT